MRRAFLLFLLAFPLQVGAHASPTIYKPTASEVLSAPPSEISISFTEHIDENASSITVFGPNGHELKSGALGINPEDPHTMTLGIQASESGSYTVSWHVLSADDGHFTNGAYTFIVESSSSASPTPDAQVQTDHPHSPLEKAAFAFELIGIAFLLGLFGIPWILPKAYPLSLRKQRQCALLGGVIVIFAVGLALFAQLLHIDHLVHVGYGSALGSILETTIGSLALARIILAAVITLLFFFNRARVLTGALLLVLLYLRGRVSHAAATPVLPEFAIVMMFVHLLGKELWIGLLMVYSFFARPEQQAREEKNASERLLAIILIGCLLLGGLGGVFIVWLHAKSLWNIFSSDWGRWFSTLVIIGVLFLTMRLIHYWFLIKDRHSHARTVMLFYETHIGIIILLLSGMVAAVTPPLTAAHFEQQVEAQDATITLTQSPEKMDQMVLTFEALKPLPISTVTLSLTNESANIGPIVIHPSPLDEQLFAFSRSHLDLPGEWHVALTAEQQGSYDINASFDLVSPDDIDQDAHKRSKPLTIMSIMAAVVLLLGCGYLLRELRKSIYKRGNF